MSDERIAAVEDTTQYLQTRIAEIDRRLRELAEWVEQRSRRKGEDSQRHSVEKKT